MVADIGPARVASAVRAACASDGAQPPAGRPPAVVVDRLSKSFLIPHERHSTLKERVVHRFSPKRCDPLTALADVSFEVGRGECFGIVGRNGSGKSTLLKCLAGIYGVDRGYAAVEGRLSPFVEMGVGFDPELTGRDNVLVNGVLLGLSRSQVRERFDDIVAFGGLEQFVDLKLKNYSSGMSVRLSFSVAIQVDADVLLVDEVLAVGDASFQEKCFVEFERLRRAGRTILLVTHDMDAVERLCDRALLLHQGRVQEIGDPGSVARAYRRINAGASGLGARVDSPRDAAVSQLAEPLHADARPPAFADAGGALRRYRPTALDGGLRRFAGMTSTLAMVDFKLHYMDSVLGYLWSVMRPLMLFAVTYLVFTRVGGFGRGVSGYPVYLLTSIVLWTYFAESTTGAAGCLLGKQELLRKLRFPRLVVPLSVVLKALFNLGMNLIAVAVLVAVSGIPPRLSWLELPLLVAIIAVLSTGVSMLVSALFVRFRDIVQIWAVLVQLLFFGSSVLYVVTQFPEGLQQAMVLNPLAMVFTQMRHALVDPSAPSAAAVAGGGLRLAIPLGVVAGVFALGLWVFARESATMAEDL